MNSDVAAVIEELDAHRAKFEAFCRSLSDEQLARPVPNSTWIVKDFISHLATIDAPVGRMFKSVHDGTEPSMGSDPSERFHVDNWNDHRVEERRGQTVEQILAEAAQERAALHAIMAELTAEDIARNLKFGGDSKRGPAEFPLVQYLRGWNKHDPMHVVDMMRALPEKASPELDAWFDDPAIRGYQASMNAQPS